MLGDGARFEAMELVSSFEDLRGHNIGVTALDGAKAGLAEYAHFCGALPADWDAAADGEHYCLAAPGVHEVDYPYNPGPITDQGTSYAAPVVSATLAMMKDRFRGHLGNVELVKRLMTTADDGLHEDDGPDHDGTTSVRYGAGVVDPVAALSPVGGLATGTAGNSAALGATRLRTPAAYGDAVARIARVEVASFDARNVPFWSTAGDLARAGAGTVEPIPRFEDDNMARESCPALSTLAPRWDCLPFSRDGSAHRLVGPDGAGLRVPSFPGLSFSALTRTPGRLDGDARGAFSFEAGSSVLAVEADRHVALDDGGRWSLAGSATLALDLPRGVGGRSGSMFEAGPTLISSWRLGLERRDGGRRSGLTLSQPARVEARTGHLRFPTGRRIDGTRRFGHVGVSAPPVLADPHRSVVAPPARGAGRGHRLALPQPQSGAHPEPGRLRRGRCLANALVGGEHAPGQAAQGHRFPLRRQRVTTPSRPPTGCPRGVPSGVRGGVASRAGSMSMSTTRASLCVLPFLAACGAGSADGKRAEGGGTVALAGGVSVARYCEKFAEAYLETSAVEYTGLSVRTEKNADLMMRLSNMFQPSDSRSTAGYDCRFTARNDQGQVRTVSVGLFLTGTLEFAHYTKWKNLQIIPVGNVVDDTRGRAGFGVFKYLEEP